MDTLDTTSQLLSELRKGSEHAAFELWSRCSRRLASMARLRIAPAMRRVADEEDVAQSVFRYFCHALQHGSHQRVGTCDEMWYFLTLITARKTVDHHRRYSCARRGGGKTRGDSIFTGREGEGFHRIPDDTVPPDFLVAVIEEQDRLFSLLESPLRDIVKWKLEGYSNEEVADKIGVSVRSVERKLQRIRARWSEEIRHAPE